MSREEEYRICLLHVAKFLSGDGFDQFKPVSAQMANNVIGMCNLVLDGKTTAQAIDELNGAKETPTPSSKEQSNG